MLRTLVVLDVALYMGAGDRAMWAHADGIANELYPDFYDGRRFKVLEYVKHMSHSHSWGSWPELAAIGRRLQRPVYCFRLTSTWQYEIALFEPNQPGPPLLLCRRGEGIVDGHYEYLVPKVSAAPC